MGSNKSRDINLEILALLVDIDPKWGRFQINYV